MLRIEDIRFGDLVTWGTKDWIYEVVGFGAGGVDLLYRPGHCRANKIARSLQRPPLKPGVWVRHVDWNEKTPALVTSPCESGWNYRRHGVMFHDLDDSNLIPVAQPPDAEDMAGEGRSASATGEPGEVAAAAIRAGSGEGAASGPLLPPPPVPMPACGGGFRALLDRTSAIRAPVSPCCVRCQANPGRTNCEECGHAKKGALTSLDEVAEITRRVHEEIRQEDEPDPARWDRCQEGAVFVRGDVVIHRSSPLEGYWEVSTPNWRAADVSPRGTRTICAWPTPRAAAEWADEHLPEGR